MSCDRGALLRVAADRGHTEQLNLRAFGEIRHRESVIDVTAWVRIQKDQVFAHLAAVWHNGGVLETPLIGRYQGEDKRLAFLPPWPYLLLVRAVTAAGITFTANAFFGFLPGFWSGWWFFVGMMLILAAVLAGLSLHRVMFDLRERAYKRRQGPGFFPKSTSGSLSNLDAVQLISEPSGRRVTYHLLLHWKQGMEPSMILHQETRVIGPGQPLGLAADNIRNLGIRWAKSLGVTFYDNSHYASPNPTSVWR